MKAVILGQPMKKVMFSCHSLTASCMYSLKYANELTRVTIMKFFLRFNITIFNKSFLRTRFLGKYMCVCDCAHILYYEYYTIINFATKYN